MARKPPYRRESREEQDLKSNAFTRDIVSLLSILKQWKEEGLQRAVRLVLPNEAICYLTDQDLSRKVLQRTHDMSRQENLPTGKSADTTGNLPTGNLPKVRLLSCPHTWTDSRPRLIQCTTSERL